MSRTALLGDIHFPVHHKQAWNFVLTLLPQLNLDSVFIGGDCFELEQLSRFLIPPNRMLTLQYDIQKSQVELGRLRKAMPGVPIELMGGNHEERYEKLLYAKAPQLVGVKGHNVRDAFGLDDYDIRWLPVGSRLQKGKLLLLHSHEVPVGSANVAKNLYAKINGNVFAFHHHAEGKYIHTLGSSKKQEGAWVNSCLRTLQPSWAPFSHWTLGFAIADFSTGGFFHIEQILFLKRGAKLWTKIGGKEYWSE